MRALGSLLLLACASSALADGDLIVRAGRAFDGERFIEAPVALIARGGRLVSGEAAPGSAMLDASALVVMPGMIDLRSGAGLPSWDANEERAEVTAAWRALDAVEPQSDAMRRALESGITTIVVSPGGRNVIGGLAGALKTDSRPMSERIVDAEAALVITLGFEPAIGNRTARFQQPWGLKFRRPGNRMGVVADIRRAIFVAREGATGEDAATMRRVLAREIPAWFVARTDGDVRTALLLAGEMGVQPVLVEAFEAHRRAEEVASARGSAILGPDYQLPRTLTERVEGRDARAATSSILAAAGVPVAIGTGMDDDPGVLRDRAGLAFRHGMPREAALAAITSVPAKLLGAAGRLGTLKPGADADLVLLDGDPLSPATRIAAVVIEGRLIWRRPPCPELKPAVPEVR